MNPSVAAAAQSAGLTRFDAREAVRLRRTSSGSLAVAQFPRLLEGLPEGQAGEVAWSVRGFEGSLGQPCIALTVRAELVVGCQRCLQPFALPVDSAVVLELVASEAELEAEAGEADESDDAAASIDKIVCAGTLNLLEQIEDELILSLPYIPRHDVCPQPLATPAEPEFFEPERRNPFAALETLKPALRPDREPDTQ